MTFDDMDPFIAAIGGSGLRVAYTWTAENRLASVEPVEPAYGDLKVEFGYDYTGRRVRKTVYTWDSTQWQLAADTEQRMYLWSGWKMLIELDDQGEVWNKVRKYTWGLDLAGQNGSFADVVR